MGGMDAGTGPSDGQLAGFGTLHDLLVHFGALPDSPGVALVLDLFFLLENHGAIIVIIVLMSLLIGILVGCCATRICMQQDQEDDLIDEDEMRSYVHSRRAGGPRRRGLAAMGLEASNPPGATSRADRDRLPG
jgi:hypothetical protein